MNKWQAVYCNEDYNGKAPRTRIGKEKLELLGQVKETVTVEFPEGRAATYTVTENDCDMPNGKISVSVLASNLVLWTARGYKVTTK